jgi:hypothetical protein
MNHQRTSSPSTDSSTATRPEIIVLDNNDGSKSQCSDNSKEECSHLEKSITASSAAKKNNHDIIGGKETRYVKQLRGMVLLVLIASTVTVALAVYFYTSRAEVKQFQLQYKDNAQKVIAAIGDSVEHTTGAIDILATHIRSYVHNTNQTWPRVTLPDFAEHASKVRSMSDSIWIAITPLVSYYDKELWEDYAWENQEWLNESVRYQQYNDTNYFGPIVYTNEVQEPNRSIYSYFGEIPRYVVNN